MRVVGLSRAFYHIARHLPLALSPKAQERLRWLSRWQALREHGLSSTRASQALGYLTLKEYLLQCQHRKEEVSLIT